MTPHTRRLLATAATLLWAACGDSAGPESTVEGTYALYTINGATLPTTTSDAGFTIRVNSGSITIQSGNRFSTSINAAVVFGEDTFPLVGTCDGTFTRNGSTLSLFTTASSREDFECSGDPTTATWDGARTITISGDGGVVIYRK